MKAFNLNNVIFLLQYLLWHWHDCKCVVIRYFQNLVFIYVFYNKKNELNEREVYVTVLRNIPAIHKRNGMNGKIALWSLVVLQFQYCVAWTIRLCFHITLHTAFVTTSTISEHQQMLAFENLIGKLKYLFNNGDLKGCIVDLFVFYTGVISTVYLLQMEKILFNIPQEIQEFLQVQPLSLICCKCLRVKCGRIQQISLPTWKG